MRVVVIMLLACASAVAGAREDEHVPGHVLVKWKDEGTSPRALRGARHQRRLGGAAHLYHAGDAAAATALAARLARDPDVEWVELEGVRRRHAGPTPDDPLFAMQWTLPLSRIPDAWNHTRGSPSVVVAIVDTGVTPHPDLVDRTLSGYDFVSEAQNAGDGDGRDDDATDPGNSLMSSSGLHGTHVAGIIGAHVDNHVGIAGVDWGCRLLAVRVLGIEGGKGADSDIADGIRWAGGLEVPGVPANPTPAAIINMSFGGPGGSRILQAAVDAVVARGVIVVSSAGNDGADTARYAPAGLNHVLAIGAVDEKGRLASYSNRGPRIDLVAPGGNLADGPTSGVLSTMRIQDTYTYVYLHGTSQAAPHVTGVLALARALDPTLDSAQARELLVGSANPNYRCDEDCGAGLLDAEAALVRAEAWGTCDPACGAGLECRQAVCVARAIALVGGCAVAPPGRGAWLAALLAAVALALGLRRRRMR